MDSIRLPLILAGRVLLALMFILSGFGKLTHLPDTAAYFTGAGLPAPMIVAVLVGLLELLGGLAIATGFKARWAALVLAFFTLGASLVAHRYWSMPADQQMIQQLLFMKNLSVAGGLLVLAALGPGPASLGHNAPR